jgi:hypothetical protein
VQHHVVFEGGHHFSHVANQSAVDGECSVREGFLQVRDALKHEP